MCSDAGQETRAPQPFETPVFISKAKLSFYRDMLFGNVKDLNERAGAWTIIIIMSQILAKQ